MLACFAFAFSRHTCLPVRDRSGMNGSPLFWAGLSGVNVGLFVWKHSPGNAGVAVFSGLVSVLYGLCATGDA